MLIDGLLIARFRDTVAVQDSSKVPPIAGRMKPIKRASPYDGKPIIKKKINLSTEALRTAEKSNSS